jgi:hypothetical protein
MSTVMRTRWKKVASAKSQKKNRLRGEKAIEPATSKTPITSTITLASKLPTQPVAVKSLHRRRNSSVPRSKSAASWRSAKAISFRSYNPRARTAAKASMSNTVQASGPVTSTTWMKRRTTL